MKFSPVLLINQSMFSRYTILIFILMVLAGCTGIETDKLSDDLEYRPNLSVPLGKLTAQYDELYELPVDLPDPIDSEPVSWEETEIMYFDLEASISERKYILSMLLQFDIVNRYPAAMEVELYLVDALGQETALTTSPIELEAAQIDESGAIVQPANTDPYPYQLPLSDEQIDALLDAQELIAKGVVKDILLSNAIVNNFSSYQLDAAVGVQAQVDFSINNN